MFCEEDLFASCGLNVIHLLDALVLATFSSRILIKPLTTRPCTTLSRHLETFWAAKLPKMKLATRRVTVLCTLKLKRLRWVPSPRSMACCSMVRRYSSDDSSHAKIVSASWVRKPSTSPMSTSRTSEMTSVTKSYMKSSLSSAKSRRTE